jgi:putative spermidine/putrescine transport system substrate-binding protein
MQLSGLGILGASLRWPDLTSAQGKPSKITAVAYGGTWQKAVQENFVTCFKAKTGVDAEVLVGTPDEWIQKVHATYQREPAIDMLLSTSAGTIRAMKLGILEKLDEARVPNLRDVPAIFKDPFDGYAASFDGGAYGLAYNKERVKNPPETWVEFVERIIRGDFGNRVMWLHVSQTSGPEHLWWLAKNFGGDVNNVRPAFEKLRQMKKNVLRFNVDVPSPGNALIAGEIDVCLWPDGRLWGAVDGGAKHLSFKYLKPQCLMNTVEWMKVKNSHPITWEYLNCGFDPVAQAGFVKSFPGFFMTNRNVKYPPDHLARLEPTAADFSFKNYVFAPYKEIVPQIPQWLEQWNREIG